MSEREPIPQQPTENQTETEKAAEEEKRAALEILEKLYDPFTNDNWLVHYTPDFQTLDSILGKGILSKTYADTARELGHENVPDINDRGTKARQDPRYISCWYKYSYCNKENFVLVIPFGWKGTSAQETGLLFEPLRNENPGQGPAGQSEKIIRFKVARNRFRVMVTQALNNYDEIDQQYAKRAVEQLKTRAKINHLPIIDNCYNLLYPLEIAAEDLQQITIPRLRELAKTLGIEKLRAMSVEEIKSTANALKGET